MFEFSNNHKTIMMNINNIIFLLTLVTLISCGKETDTGGPTDKDNEVQITQAQLDGLNQLCMTEADNINLPTPLTLLENYSSNEYTTEIWLASTFSKAVVSTFGFALTPSILAKVEQADGINIFDGQEAYTWGEAPNIYTYIVNSDGYKIIHFTDKSEIFGTEKIRVTQNEDCSSFEIIQRATKEDEEFEIGTIIFKMYYINNDHKQQYAFSDLSSGDNRTYLMRSFNDLSGDLRVTDTSTESEMSMIWNADGDGTWQKVMDGVVETGNWNF